MGQFVGDSHVQELVQRDAPFLQERSTASCPWLEECLLEKRLTPLQDGERRTVRVATNAAQDRVPIVGTHQNPVPVSKRAQVEFSERLLKTGDLA